MLAVLIALALSADPAPAARPRTVAGKIASVDPGESCVTLEASDGPVRLSVDRNTMVFLETRLGTPRDLVAGVPARASVGPGGQAFWIELRPRGVVPTPRAGEQGSAPEGRKETPAASGPASPGPTTLAAPSPAAPSPAEAPPSSR